MRKGGQLQQQQQAACEHRLPKKGKKTKTKARSKRRDVNDRNELNKNAVTEKHLGDLSVRGLPVGSSLTRRGAVVRCEEEKGETESKKKRYRDRKGDGRRREQHSSLCSLNEVFLLLFCVCMVALSVDDGCVSVGRIVRSFGLVCQVRSFMPGQVSSQNND